MAQDILLIRFNAPMISLGAPTVDNYGKINPFPATSMLTGLLANALGHDHRDYEKTQRLQQRLQYAVRCDKPGEKITDYQTVDLGQDFMACDGWTTRGEVEQRAGGSAKRGTHIRHRDYWADSLYTIALTLKDDKESPDISDLEKCLKEPERPLFIGRKCCIPSEPLLIGRISSPSLKEALSRAPLPLDIRMNQEIKTFKAWWPLKEEQEASPAKQIPVNDLRDWKNQIHVGRRVIVQGNITINNS